MKPLRIVLPLLLLTGTAHAEPNFKASLFRQSLGAGADWAGTGYSLGAPPYADGSPSTSEWMPLHRGGSLKRAVVMEGEAVAAAFIEWKLEKSGHGGWAKVVRWGVPAIKVIGGGIGLVRGHQARKAAHNMRVAK